MSNIKILILEDEPALLEGLVTYLNLKGFTADGVSTIKSAELWMQTHVFDILIRCFPGSVTNSVVVENSSQ